jgi:hypothetical protein
MTARSGSVAVLLLAACDTGTAPPVEEFTFGEGSDDSSPPTDDTGTSIPDDDSGLGGTTGQLVGSLSAKVSDDVGSIIVVKWNQAESADTHLEFSFESGSWLSSRTRTRDAGVQQDLILGVPYERTVTWRLVVQGGKSAYTSPDATIKTDDLPSGLPENKVDEDAWDPTLQEPTAPYWFVGIAPGGYPTATWWTMIVDRQGRVVWAMEPVEERTSMHAHVARDGKTLFLDRSSFWTTFDRGADSTIDQVTIDGDVVHTFETPGLHHPFDDMPDGSIAYGAAQADGSEKLEIVTPDDDTEEVWDCGDWRASIGSGGGCNSNTLRYDEASNKFLFSFYNFNSIVEIDRDSGDVERWWGHETGSYAFDPDDSAFWWQHGGYITSAGTLMTSTNETSGGKATIVREYEIDDKTQTLHEIWSFGEDEGIYGGVMGEATRLPNGNTERNCGGTSRMQEVTPDGTVVWDIEWENGSADIGRSTYITDLYDLAP